MGAIIRLGQTDCDCTDCERLRQRNQILTGKVSRALCKRCKTFRDWNRRARKNQQATWLGDFIEATFAIHSSWEWIERMALYNLLPSSKEAAKPLVKVRKAGA